MSFRVDRLDRVGGVVNVYYTPADGSGKYPASPMKLMMALPVATAAAYRAAAYAMIPAEALAALAIADWLDAGQPSVGVVGKQVSIGTTVLSTITAGMLK